MNMVFICDVFLVNTAVLLHNILSQGRPTSLRTACWDRIWVYDMGWCYCTGQVRRDNCLCIVWNDFIHCFVVVIVNDLRTKLPKNFPPHFKSVIALSEKSNNEKIANANEIILHYQTNLHGESKRRQELRLTWQISSECVHCVSFRWPTITILGKFWGLMCRPPFTDEGQVWCVIG